MFGLVTRKRMESEKKKEYKRGRLDVYLENRIPEYPGDIDIETVSYQEWRDRTEKFWEQYRDLKKLFGDRTISIDGRYELRIDLNLYDYEKARFSLTGKKYDDVPEEVMRAHLAIKDRYDRWVAGDGPPPVCIGGEVKR